MTSSSPADILSSVGQELRGPVTGVLGFAALLSSTDLSSEQREYLENLSHSAQSLLSQVNSLLDLARLENRTLELEPSSVSFSDLVQEAVLLAQRQTQQCPIHIETKIDDALPSRIRIDRMRVQQILGHLLENATRFTEHGTIQVSASLRPILTSTPQPPQSTSSAQDLIVEVRDSGPGIPKEFQNQVFQAFRPGDTCSARRSGGIGIGLALCRKLIHLMGGQIGFECQPKEGTRFWFSLPLHIPSSSDDETACILAFPRTSPIR